MSGPSYQMSKQRFNVGDMQKLGTTKFIFQDMNQLKDDCKELLFQSRKVSLRCGTDKVEDEADGRNRLSDVTRESNFEHKLSENYTAPNSKSSELYAGNEDCTVLPEINQKHFKINGRAAFKKIFSNKSLAKCKVVYKVAKQANPTFKKKLDLFEESDRKYLSPANVGTTKSSVLNDKINAIYKRKSDLISPRVPELTSRAPEVKAGNTQDFLQKVIMSHNEIRDEKIKLLKMASMKKIDKHPQDLPISYKHQQAVKSINEACITFGSN